LRWEHFGFKPYAFLAEAIPWVGFKIDKADLNEMDCLWDTWRKPDGTTLSTITLLTTTQNELVRTVHDRMPVILDTDAALQWLACTLEPAAHCLDLLKPFPAEPMIAYEVPWLVKSGKIDSPECMEPI
jgi:putative SOS response-associated peptidase YedK